MDNAKLMILADLAEQAEQIEEIEQRPVKIMDWMIHRRRFVRARRKTPACYNHKRMHQKCDCI